MASEKKYGLIKIQGLKKGQGLKNRGAKVSNVFGSGSVFGKSSRSKSEKVAGRLKPSVFGSGTEEDDEDDGEDGDGSSNAQKHGVKHVNAQIRELQSKSIKTMEKLAAKAVAENGGDASIFEYDSLYDDMHADKNEKAKAKMRAKDPSYGGIGEDERKKAAPRYIAQLQKAAEIRQVNDERLFQLKLKKEADAEAHIYGQTEKFVTAAYKEKLQEIKRWKDEDARLAALEDATTVEGAGDMTGFYKNLLTKNLAMGTGDVERDATSAYTVGSRRNEHIRDLERRQKEQQDGANRETKRHGGSVGESAADIEEELLRRMEHRTEAATLKEESFVGGIDGESEQSGITEPSCEDHGREATVDCNDHSTQTRKRPVDDASSGSNGTITGNDGDVEAVVSSSADVAVTLETNAQDGEKEKAHRKSSIKSARERYLARKKAKISQ